MPGRDEVETSGRPRTQVWIGLSILVALVLASIGARALLNEFGKRVRAHSAARIQRLRDAAVEMRELGCASCLTAESLRLEWEIRQRGRALDEALRRSRFGIDETPAPPAGETTGVDPAPYEVGSDLREALREAEVEVTEQYVVTTYLRSDPGRDSRRSDRPPVCIVGIPRPGADVRRAIVTTHDPRLVPAEHLSVTECEDGEWEEPGTGRRVAIEVRER